MCVKYEPLVNVCTRKQQDIWVSIEVPYRKHKQEIVQSEIQNLYYEYTSSLTDRHTDIDPNSM